MMKGSDIEGILTRLEYLENAFERQNGGKTPAEYVGEWREHEKSLAASTSRGLRKHLKKKGKA